MDQDRLEIADRWWARDFAVTPVDLRPTSPRVQAHAGRMVGAAGVWILSAGARPLVSIPAPFLRALEPRARAWTEDVVEDPAALAAELSGLPVERIVGPAFIGYGSRASVEEALPRLRPASPVTDSDAAAVRALRAACTEEEWSHGGCDPRAVPAFGSYASNGALAALAGYLTWGGEIAHIAVVAAPDHRGAGHAKSAVAAAARHALDAGLLPQYRTLAANAPSMAIARELGFERYGSSVFVRLRLDPAQATDPA